MMRAIVLAIATVCAAIWFGCSGDGVYVPDEPDAPADVDAGELEAVTSCAQGVECDAGAD